MKFNTSLCFCYRNIKFLLTGIGKGTQVEVIKGISRPALNSIQGRNNLELTKKIKAFYSEKSLITLG